MKKWIRLNHYLNLSLFFSLVFAYGYFSLGHEVLYLNNLPQGWSSRTYQLQEKAEKEVRNFVTTEDETTYEDSGLPAYSVILYEMASAIRSWGPVFFFFMVVSSMMVIILNFRRLSLKYKLSLSLILFSCFCVSRMLII